MKLMKVIAVVGVGAASVAVAAVLFVSGWQWIRSVVAQDDIPVCTAGKFEVESHSARAVGQRTIVTVAVRNNNPVACGVQVSVAVKDGEGKQIAIEPLWAAGVSNIPAGATQSFPVYLSIEVSARAVDYDIKPINSRVWRQQ
ncbi:MAG TPA: hypothetical protein VLJ19_00440 [Variovorax sp.]|nr:hypothetical protein [Variovorax sp.]